ncbi:FAD-dependent monooxygenase [Streptomyces tricolor]|nr:FAD-dependent monooxygenase [Streptomyces tricolor]
MLGTRLDFRALDTPFPYTLALPQARTEELFEERALALGARILRGHRVTGLAEDPQGVTVRVEGPRRAVRPPGRVRRRLRRSPQHRPRGGRHRLPRYGRRCRGVPRGRDARQPAAARLQRLRSGRRPDGRPAARGLFRLVGITPDDVTTTWPGRSPADELRAKVRAVAGQDFGLHSPVWLSRFGNATRQAQRYRRGRVLLRRRRRPPALPHGRSRDERRIQDAHNLGWKLAAVIGGRGAGALLDTYHRERHPVGAATAVETQSRPDRPDDGLLTEGRGGCAHSSTRCSPPCRPSTPPGRTGLRARRRLPPADRALIRSPAPAPRTSRRGRRGAAPARRATAFLLDPHRRPSPDHPRRASPCEAAHENAKAFPLVAKH